jgi:hypothetical protein
VAEASAAPAASLGGALPAGAWEAFVSSAGVAGDSGFSLSLFTVASVTITTRSGAQLGMPD